MMKSESRKYLEELFEKHRILDKCKKSIFEAAELLIECFKNDKKLLICGNGGSAADCEHVVGELMKGFKKKRTISQDLKNKIGDSDLSSKLQYGLPAISLVSQTALITATINDSKTLDTMFAQQVLGYGKNGDVLLCISTSGNSANCVAAARVAKALGLKVITLTGGQENFLLKPLSDCSVQVPIEKDTDKIQEFHLPIYHAICLAIEAEFFEN